MRTPIGCVLGTSLGRNFDNWIWSHIKEKKILMKKKICKTQSFHILFGFLIITIALFIAASNYCCLIK